MRSYDDVVERTGLPEAGRVALTAPVPVDWMDGLAGRATGFTSLPPGTVLDSAPLVLIDLDPWAPAFIKIRVDGRDGFVRPDRLKEALPEWTSIAPATWR